jgi:ArsR family transcriptional regulator
LAEDAERPEPARRDGRDPSAKEGLQEPMATNLIEPPVTETRSVTETLPVADARVDRRFPELSGELEKELVQVFKLLSDETRLRILVYLARESELHVTALCDRLGQSQPAVSHHLALLRVAGLIKARRDGKHNYYSVRQSRFRRLIEQVFQNISDPGKDQFRFDEFVVTHEH